jgi:hypothetical protein
MTGYDWNETAREVADFVQQLRPIVDRGAIPLQLDARDAVAGEDEPVVVGMFGNDNDPGNSGSREVELVRNRLQDSPLEELGYGESSDGSTWALVIGAVQSPCLTPTGHRFQRELLQIFLDDLVWRAWNTLQIQNAEGQNAE